tara:strand:+ start:20 stop:130 length:111 start_codon:yes stop_codon:yes gene_type:complete
MADNIANHENHYVTNVPLTNIALAKQYKQTYVKIKK